MCVQQKFMRLQKTPREKSACDSPSCLRTVVTRFVALCACHTLGGDWRKGQSVTWTPATWTVRPNLLTQKV